MLVPGHQLLYFFEGEDSAKPKGVINLSRLSVVPLDESMFKKKFCFQITSQDGTFSFAANSEENREEWVAVLYPITMESFASRDEVSFQKKENFVPRLALKIAFGPILGNKAN